MLKSMLFISLWSFGILLASSFFFLTGGIIKNLARLSESYIVRFPGKNVGSFSFTNMLSTRVTDFEVIRDGVVICGRRVFECTKSKTDTSLSRSKCLRFVLNSISKAIIFFSKDIFSGRFVRNEFCQPLCLNIEPNTLGYHTGCQRMSVDVGI